MSSEHYVIGQRGEPISESDLIAELFGATTGPWSRLLKLALSNEARIAKLSDGRWTQASAFANSESILKESAMRETAAAYDAVDFTAIRESEIGPSDATVDRVRYVGLVVMATGPKPWRHPIVAIGAARHRDNDRIERFETFVRPERRMRIPDYLARFGISGELLEDASGLGQVLDDVEAFCGDATLVGVDIALAVAHLQFALRALDRPPMTNPMIELAVATVERPDLERLARARGLAFPIRPRPASMATVALRLVDDRGNLDDQVETDAPASEPRPTGSVSALDATDGRSLLDDAQLSSIPDAAGIYLFRGRDERVLYVGKATSLRQRLASYLTGNFRVTRQMSGLIDGTDRLEWEVHVCELSARAREAEIIAMHLPPYNVRRGASILALTGLTLAPTSPSTAAIVPRLTLDSGGGAIITTRSAAREALSAARRDWWPSRPRRADRPDDMMIARRLDRLRSKFFSSCRSARIGPSLTCGNLDLLLVVAPLARRMARPRSETRQRRSDDDQWWLVDDEATFDSAERLAAFFVGPAGTGLAAQLGIISPDTSSDTIRRVALAAIGHAPNEAAQATIGGLAALNTIVLAYQRGERGILIFPLDVAPHQDAPTTTFDPPNHQTRFALPEN